MPITAEILASRTTPHLSWNHSFPLGGSPNLDAWASPRKAAEFVAEEFSRSGHGVAACRVSEVIRSAVVRLNEVEPGPCRRAGSRVI